MASKKVYFLTVWTAQNREDLQGLAKVVDIEYGEIQPFVVHTHTAANATVDSADTAQPFL